MAFTAMDFTSIGTWKLHGNDTHFSHKQERLCSRTEIDGSALNLSCSQLSPSLQRQSILKSHLIVIASFIIPIFQIFSMYSLKRFVERLLFLMLVGGERRLIKQVI